jgi:hypothetical protein
MPNLRWFIAEVEKTVWEDEIIAGTVKVHKHPRSSWDGHEDGNDSPRKRSIKVGRTCSKSYEETLKRLEEWSAVLDVIHHVDVDHHFDSIDAK